MDIDSRHNLLKTSFMAEKKKSILKKDLKNPLKKKDEILTPQLELEIRTDERIVFARSFNFQCLYADDEVKSNWQQIAIMALLVFNLVIIIWRT